MLWVFHDGWVCGGQLIKKLAHLFRGLDVSVGLGGVLSFFHSCPRQEERKVLVDFAQWESSVLCCFQVVRDHLRVISDDNETGCELNDNRGDAEPLQFLQEVSGSFAEVDDVLLSYFVFRILSDVERAIAKTGDVSLGTAVGEHEIEDELAVVFIVSSKRFDAFFDCFEV